MLAAGCAMVGGTADYVSPRITGRVLDEPSRAPLKDVQVRRLLSEDKTSEGHGGARLLDSASEVRTGADGRFVMESVRAFQVIGSYGWYSVTLAFQKSGYLTATKSYTLTEATNTPSGEPLVNTGDVLLPRIGK